METNKRGGKREGAGRKSTGRTKKPYTFYIAPNETLKFGGEEKFKKHIYDHVEKYGEELKFTPATKESYDGKDLKPSQLDEPLQYEKTKANYFSPASPTVIVDQFQAYSNELNESITFEEAKTVAVAFRNDRSLSNKNKLSLEALFLKVIEDKGFYIGNQ